MTITEIYELIKKYAHDHGVTFVRVVAMLLNLEGNDVKETEQKNQA